MSKKVGFAAEPDKGIVADARHANGPNKEWRPACEATGTLSRSNPKVRQQFEAWNRQFEIEKETAQQNKQNSQSIWQSGNLPSLPRLYIYISQSGAGSGFEMIFVPGTLGAGAKNTSPYPPRLWPIMNNRITVGSYDRPQSHYCRFMIGHSLWSQPWAYRIQNKEA